MHTQKKLSKVSGFTIVELLIVIVVIGILAAISIVAYNGIQERARYGTMQQDLASVNKAILMYHADKGYYPYSGTASGNTGHSIDNIPGLSEYLPNPPKFPSGARGYYVYIWTANGAEYKLLRLVGEGETIPTIEQSNSNIDPNRSIRGWGYWSAGGRTI